MRIVAESTGTMTRWGMWRTDADLRVLLTTPGKRIALLAPLVWCDPDGAVFVVPVGFVSDGASIPRWLWSIVGGPLDGPYLRAAIVHDWQCATRTQAPSVVHERFYRMMRADAVPWWIARTFYRGVQWKGPQWPHDATLSASQR